jgi:sterol desaturase/sphingolipid hydroxylase (fatty acid hydroxylase superfamily)
MAEKVVMLMSGLFAWTFIEYLIHGWLGHTFRTFATPLHAVHHRDPRAVFTIGGWIPVAVVWLAFASLFGWCPGMIFFSGAVLGFAAYEVIHYRIHFCRPAGSVENYLRSRHLAHHERYPKRCFGVTSPLWDYVFRTEPIDAGIAELYKEMAWRAPLAGPTNFHKLTDFILRRRSGHLDGARLDGARRDCGGAAGR